MSKNIHLFPTGLELCQLHFQNMGMMQESVEHRAEFTRDLVVVGWSAASAARVWWVGQHQCPQEVQCRFVLVSPLPQLVYNSGNLSKSSITQLKQMALCSLELAIFVMEAIAERRSPWKSLTNCLSVVPKVSLIGLLLWTFFSWMPSTDLRTPFCWNKLKQMKKHG